MPIFSKKPAIEKSVKTSSPASETGVKNPLQKILGFVVAALASYYAAHLMARLSGLALWVPVGWRQMSDAVISIFGGAIFVATRAVCNLAEVAAKRWSHNGAQIFPIAAFAVSAGCALLAMGFLMLFMFLRSETQFHFDGRDWLASQEKRNSLEANQIYDQERRAGATAYQPTTQEFHDKVVAARRKAAEPVGKSEKEPGLVIKFWNLLFAAEPKQVDSKEANNVDPIDGLDIPEFVDIPQQSVYLPVVFPKSLNDYINAEGVAHETSGLTYMLAYEPDHLFNIIETEASGQITFTNLLFLLIDICVVGFAMCAAGLAYEPAAALSEVLA